MLDLHSLIIAIFLITIFNCVLGQKSENEKVSFNYMRSHNDHIINHNGHLFTFLNKNSDQDMIRFNMRKHHQHQKRQITLMSNFKVSDDNAAHRFNSGDLENRNEMSLVRVDESEKIRNSFVKHEYQEKNDYCFYANVKAKLDDCFQNSTDCKTILGCIASFNLVEVCHHYDMNTPAIWIVNVFEILNNKGFCNSPVECESSDNEYLRKLNEIIKTFYEYGQAYLDQPKVDNKVYCSKSHHLVRTVKDLFDNLNQCFNILLAEAITSAIEDSASSILDKNCQYCISTNSIFDDCEVDNYGNEYTCSGSLSCIYKKIDQFKCNKDRDTTPLVLISSLMKNISSICEIDANKNGTTSLVVEWFKNINYCIKEKRFLGLTILEAPPNVDLCHEMDEVFKCIHNSVHNIERIKNKIIKQFSYFANQYTRLQRQCDVHSITSQQSKMGAGNRVGETTRHPFQNNSEQTILEDNKNYYHQTIIRAELDQAINWVNIDGPEFVEHQVKKDDDLSKNYLKATIVKLKFKFPYYGHLLDQIVVATGGFLYVGSLMNPLITKAQYIAPLMANFDPTLNNGSSVIKYVDNSTHFIVCWQGLILQDQPENGEYTFQAILDKDGGIIFNYKKIPTMNISTINHTVKIGLSDAYVYYKALSNSKIEYTIVQYHVVNVLMENIKTGNSIMFFMLRNCLQLKSCDACSIGLSSFKCMWCPTLQRCSDTMDRYRQEWIEASCPLDYNPHATSKACMSASIKAGDLEFSAGSLETSGKDTEYFKSIFAGVFVTILLSMIFTTIGWAFYAYKNPTSPSGIWLIENRPERLLQIITSRLSKNSANSSRFENPVA